MTIVVRAPGNLLVATLGNIRVRLAGVEVTKAPSFVDVAAKTPCVVVYLSAVRGYETVRHDEIAYDQDPQSHAADDEEAKLSSPPKLSNLGRVSITITDDLGGSYEPAGFRMVGDGIGWDDMRVFVPAPPSTASTLHLDFTVDGRSTERCCDVAISVR
jgi:hypothetical protein